MEKIKICTMCKEHLPATQEFFYCAPAGKDKLTTVCKPCQYERIKQYRAKLEVNQETGVVEQPKFKRYLNKGLDMVLVYRKNKLSKTMSYPLFLEKYPGAKFETLEVI